MGHAWTPTCTATMSLPHILIACNRQGSSNFGSFSVKTPTETETYAAAPGVFKPAVSPPWHFGSTLTLASFSCASTA